MKTSQLLSGLTIPFGSANQDRAGIVRLATPDEVLKATNQSLAVSPQESLILSRARNIVINGATEYWTKGNEFINLSGSSYSLADNWKVNCKGNWTYDVTKGTGGRFCTDQGSNLTFKVNNGDPSLDPDQYLLITNNLESLLLYPILDTPFSLSFNCFTSKPGTLYVSLRDNLFTRSYVVPVSVSPQWVRYKIEKIPALSEVYPSFKNSDEVLRIGFCLACGDDYKTTQLNTWTTGNFKASTNQSNFASTQNDIVRITDLQVEANPYCTTFEVRQENTQRYVESVSMEGIAAALSTTEAQGFYNWKTLKRSTPTMTINAFSWYKPGTGWIALTNYTMTPTKDNLIIKLLRDASDVVKFTSENSYVYRLACHADCAI